MLFFIAILTSLTPIDCPEKTSVHRDENETSCVDENNLKHGQAILRYMGVVRRIREYHHGVEHGVWNAFFADGSLRIEEHYLNGFRDGARIEFYQDGSIFRIGSYVRGNRHGVWVEKDKTGKISWLGRYENGFPVGRFEFANAKPITYYFNGKCSTAKNQEDKCSPEQE